MTRGLETGSDEAEGAAPSRRAEVTTFLTTCFVIFPALAVGFVGAYGFAIWLSQMIFGPPGPPAS